jgi:hypothetical protein
VVSYTYAIQIFALHREDRLTGTRYDSIPTETLVNLGFTEGDEMAQDFLDLCENPEPIENAPISPSGQDEDEEAVWRRLVMRGRFV